MPNTVKLLPSDGEDALRRKRGRWVFQAMAQGEFPFDEVWMVGNRQFTIAMRSMIMTKKGDPEFGVTFFCEDKEIEYSKPLIVVDFHTRWCEPWQMSAPALRQAVINQMKLFAELHETGTLLQSGDV